MSLFAWPWPSTLLFALGVPSIQEPIQLDEAALVQGLQRGDEKVFTSVMDSYSGSLLRLAMAFVPSRAVAEEVVQEGASSFYLQGSAFRLPGTLLWAAETGSLQTELDFRPNP